MLGRQNDHDVGRYASTLPERVRALETALEFIRANIQTEFAQMRVETQQQRGEQTTHLDRKIAELTQIVNDLKAEVSDLRQVVGSRGITDEPGRRVWWAFLAVGACVAVIAVFMVLLFIRLGPILGQG